MKTIFKTNNHVHLSWIKHILSEHNIRFFVMDSSMSSVEGNITAIPVRVVVNSEDEKIALKIIQEEEDNLD